MAAKVGRQYPLVGERIRNQAQHCLPALSDPMQENHRWTISRAFGVVKREFAGVHELIAQTRMRFAIAGHKHQRWSPRARTSAVPTSICCASHPRTYFGNAAA